MYIRKLHFILNININYEQIPIDFLKQSWIFSTSKYVPYVVIANLYHLKWPNVTPMQYFPVVHGSKYLPKMLTK